MGETAEKRLKDYRGFEVWKITDNKGTSKEEASEKYKLLHEKYGYTIWIQKIEFVNPKDLLG